MINKRPIKLLMGICLAFWFLSSCGDKERTETFENYRDLNDSLSVEVARDVRIRYTDSARIKAIIHTPIMQRYPSAKEPYMEMNEGLKAEFYDVNGEINSRLSANYGKRYERQKLIELRNNVHVHNKIGEELESEELFWDQEGKRIFTDKFVKITRKDELIYGEGFESNETFSKYKILKPKGRVKLKDQPKKEDEENS